MKNVIMTSYLELAMGIAVEVFLLSEKFGRKLSLAFVLRVFYQANA